MCSSWLPECHRQPASTGCSKLARMESRAAPEVTVLAEGVDRWWNGVCSLNRPTQGATPPAATIVTAPFPLLSCHGTGNDYRKVISSISTATLRYCTIPWHLLCFVPTSKSSLCRPAEVGPRKWGGWERDEAWPTTRCRSPVRVIELHGRGVPISGAALSAAFNCVSISSRNSTRADQTFRFGHPSMALYWTPDEIVKSGWRMDRCWLACGKNYVS